MFSIILSCAEKDLYRSSIGTVGLYLMLLMHLLESKVAIDLTRSEFTETQEVHSFFFRAGLIYIFNNHLKGFVTNRKILTFFFLSCYCMQALLQMRNWYLRFPTLLPGCDGIIEMLRGQYAHSIGCFSEAAFHFIEATKVF